MVSNEAAFGIIWEAHNDAPWCSGFYYIYIFKIIISVFLILMCLMCQQLEAFLV